MCAGEGLAYSELTEAFAGSAGTDANCGGLIQQFRDAGVDLPDDPRGVLSGNVGAGGRGCFVTSQETFGHFWVRDSEPARADAAQAISRRVCACE